MLRSGYVRATAVSSAIVRPDSPELPAWLRALARSTLALSPRHPSRFLAALAEYLEATVLLALVPGPDRRLHVADGAGRALRLPPDWSVTLARAWEPHLRRVLPLRAGEILVHYPLSISEPENGLLIAYVRDPQRAVCLAAAAAIWRETFAPPMISPPETAQPCEAWLAWAEAVSTQLGHLLEVESIAFDLLLRHVQLDSDSPLAAALATNQQTLQMFREDLREITHHDGTPTRFIALSLHRLVRAAVELFRKSGSGTRFTLPRTPGRPETVQVLGDAQALRRLLEIMLLQSSQAVSGQRLRVDVTAAPETAVVRIRSLTSESTARKAVGSSARIAVSLGTAQVIAALHHGRLVRSAGEGILWELTLPRWSGTNPNLRQRRR